MNRTIYAIAMLVTLSSSLPAAIVRHTFTGRTVYWNPVP